MKGLDASQLRFELVGELPIESFFAFADLLYFVEEMSAVICV